MDPINNTQVNMTPNLGNITNQNKNEPADLNMAGIAKEAGMARSNPRVQRSKKSFTDFNFSRLLDYLAIVVSLLVSIALVFFVLMPQYQKYNENQTLKSTLNAELVKVNAHYEYLYSLKNLGVEFDQNVALANQSITLIEEVPQVLNQIAVMSDLATTDMVTNSFSGVSVQQSAPKKVVPTALDQVVEGVVTNGTATTPPPTVKPSTLAVSTNIIGTYDQLVEFLKKVETARRLLTIVSYDISLNQSDAPGAGGSSVALTQDSQQLETAADDQIKYNVKINFNAFYMKEPDISTLPVDVLLTRPSNVDATLETLKKYTYYKLEELAPFYQQEQNNPFSTQAGQGGISETDD